MSKERYEKMLGVRKIAREEFGAQNFIVSKLCWVPGGSRQQDIAGMVTSIPRLPFHAGLQHTLKLTFLCGKMDFSLNLFPV